MPRLRLAFLGVLAMGVIISEMPSLLPYAAVAVTAAAIGCYLGFLFADKGE